MHRFSARIIWTGGAEGPAVTYEGYSREHLIEVDGKPSLRGSSAPVFRGDAGLHNPEDLLVASLSACHMLWYLHLCTDAGVHVAAYVDEADGRMDRRDGKMAFAEVVLRPKATIIAGDRETAMALHQDANQACFIANSVNFPVRHEPVIDDARAQAGMT